MTFALTNPLEDTSRWTILFSRFEPNWDAYEELGAMIDEQMEQRPVDDPVQLLWYMLPKAKRPK